MVEDNKQLILEGQLHVTLQTIGKEASSLTPKEVSKGISTKLIFRGAVPIKNKHVWSCHGYVYMCMYYAYKKL